MRWTLLTIFPECFDSPLATSLFGKAVERGLLQVDRVDLRDFTEDRHHTVDDAPFGGGPGMVMKAEPLVRAIEAVRQSDANVRVFLLGPRGRRFDQALATELSALPHVGLLCGRYEGVDERVRDFVDGEISAGDYVLSGGEPAAWVIMDAVTRLLPGVMGCEASKVEESFGDGLLEYPQYTRPRTFRGREVPEVLLSGDHGAIARYRRQEALRVTARHRPDLIERADLDEEERAWLFSESTGRRA
ncbi:MAG: tRNA (guanosine(37)-N1)-methyltransferase TrmD [Myxococcales bacterium]|nr:tRNA (guanosine(37)-N1)-methyltransferase TrmD [Myxococcales bacterium]